MGLLSFQVGKFVQSTWWGWWWSCCDFAGVGFMHRFVIQWAGFWLTVLLQFCRVRNFSAFELQQIAQKFEMLVASGETNGNNDCLNAWLGIRKSRNTSLTWIFICFFGFWIVSFLLVADVCMSLWMSLFAGDLILELVEMFLKAAMDVSSYSQQPSPRSFVYVRTRISTAEHRVSEAAWAVQGILNICLKNKEEIYNQLSPFTRCINCFSSQDKQAIGQSIQIWYLC